MGTKKDWVLKPYRQWRIKGCPTIWELWKRNEHGSWTRFDWAYTQNEMLLKCQVMGVFEEDLAEDF